MNWLDTKDQKFDDLVLLTGTTYEIPFLEFEQVPLCNYTSWYTVTLQPKGSPDLDDLVFDPSQEGIAVGSPQLVTLDLEAGRVFIDAADNSLEGNTYQVFINCHVAVNSTVQLPFSQYIPPFDVKVVSSLEPYVPDNTAPRIEQFIDKIELLPGQSKEINLGKPVDLEGDAYYVAKWSTLIDGEATMIPWVTFLNSTSAPSPTSLDFKFDPPNE